MRLIDADKFRRFAHEQLENDNLYSADDILEFIYEQPTAYDPEEVVELLEGASYFSEYLDAKTRYINLYKAIKIVREGGVK